MRDSMERKKYSIQQLADILGISVAAIRKKISANENSPDEKHYKKRYPVVTETLDNRPIMLICLTDLELEEEKRLSKINKMKHSSDTTLQETSEDNVIDMEYTREIPHSDPNIHQISQITAETLLNFTERYNNELATLHKNYTERIVAAESKQLLLEDKASREGLYLQEIKDAKTETRNVIKYFTIAILLLLALLVACTCFIIYKLQNPTIIEKQVVVEKPVIQQVGQPKKTGRR